MSTPRLVCVRCEVEVEAPATACSCGALVGMALERGLLINVTADHVVRLLPPLILSDADADARPDA